MQKQIHIRAFTLPEVALAIGVIALGLVGVFSILPYGLTAQKDNREETIIRYEAQYWTEVLLGEGLLLDELKRVERVEVRDGSGATCEFWNPFSEFPDKNNPGQTLMGRRLSGGNVNYYSSKALVLETAKKYWPSDVCGWLSIPADLNATADPHATGNFALVKSINGTLFDRSYGAEPEKPIKPKGPNDGFLEREFAMGYIMRVEPRSKLNGSEIRIEFYWPITDPILELINSPKVSLRQIVSASLNQTSLPGGIPPRFNHHEFSFSTPSVLTEALTENELTLRERRFLKALAGLKAGEEIVTSKQWTEFISNPPIPYNLHVKRDVSGMKIDPVIPLATLKADYRWSANATLNPQGWRSINGFSGYKFHSKNYPDFSYEIAWADLSTAQLEFGDDNNGSYVVRSRTNPNDMHLLPGKTEELNKNNYPWPYQIHFLGKDESWADVLEEMSNKRDSVGGYPGRLPLLDRVGTRYTLRQSLHLTTHRKIAPDELALLNIPGYDSRFFGNHTGKDWVTGEEVPRQYFLRKGIR